MKLFPRKPVADIKHPVFSRQLADVLSRHAIDIVLDVGANEGQFARDLYASGYAGRVVSFEPQASLHASLAAAAARQPGWTLAPPVALGAQEGEARLNTFNRSDMSSLLPPSPTMASAVPKLRAASDLATLVRPLDALFAGYVPPEGRALLKIDTQGYEREVLAGAQASLPKVVGVLLELAVTSIYEGQPHYLELLKALEAEGFALWLLSPGYYSKPIGRMIDFDALLLNKALLREARPD